MQATSAGGPAAPRLGVFFGSGRALGALLHLGWFRHGQDTKTKKAGEWSEDCMGVFVLELVLGAAGHWVLSKGKDGSRHPQQKGRPAARV